MIPNNTEVLVICGSSGAISSIQTLLQEFPQSCTVPILILVHQQEDKNSTLDIVFASSIKRPVVTPHDGMKIQKNTIYVAPSGYHMQVERNRTISFAMDEPVLHSRPSIDVLLETAAPVYQSKMMVILLSGASSDGTYGVQMVERYNGTIWIQEPSTTRFKTMLLSALKAVKQPTVLSIPEMIEWLKRKEGNDYESTESSNS